MSNHHTQKAINLHHNQVNAGKARRLQRQADRMQRYLAGREEARTEYQCALVFGFLGFAHIMFMTAVYLEYILWCA